MDIDFADQDLLYEYRLDKLKETLRTSIEQAEQGEYFKYSYEQLVENMDGSTT